MRHQQKDSKNATPQTNKTQRGINKENGSDHESMPELSQQSYSIQTVANSERIFRIQLINRLQIKSSSQNLQMKDGSSGAQKTKDFLNENNIKRVGTRIHTKD